jgi:hypothetical protein
VTIALVSSPLMLLRAGARTRSAPPLGLTGDFDLLTDRAVTKQRVAMADLVYRRNEQIA